MKIIGILKNAVEGRVLCKVHTDEWPEFNTVVCEIVYPRVSEVGVLAMYLEFSMFHLCDIILIN